MIAPQMVGKFGWESELSRASREGEGGQNLSLQLERERACKNGLLWVQTPL